MEAWTEQKSEAGRKSRARKKTNLKADVSLRNNQNR